MLMKFDVHVPFETITGNLGVCIYYWGKTHIIHIGMQRSLKVAEQQWRPLKFIFDIGIFHSIQPHLKLIVVANPELKTGAVPHIWARAARFRHGNCLVVFCRCFGIPILNNKL